MTAKPRRLRRLQRSRTRPLPPGGGGCVTLLSRWGNPYRVEDHGSAEAVALFRQQVPNLRRPRHVGASRQQRRIPDVGPPLPPLGSIAAA